MDMALSVSLQLPKAHYILAIMLDEAGPGALPSLCV